MESRAGVPTALGERMENRELVDQREAVDVLVSGRNWQHPGLVRKVSKEVCEVRPLLLSLIGCRAERLSGLHFGKRRQRTLRLARKSRRRQMGGTRKAGRAFYPTDGRSAVGPEVRGALWWKPKEEVSIRVEDECRPRLNKKAYQNGAAFMSGHAACRRECEGWRARGGEKTRRVDWTDVASAHGWDTVIGKSQPHVAVPGSSSFGDCLAIWLRVVSQPILPQKPDGTQSWLSQHHVAME